MTDTVNQPSNNPTRKLSAATISAAAMAVSGLIVRNLWPHWFDASVWLTLTPIVSFAIGYLVKDAPNVETSP